MCSRAGSSTVPILCRTRAVVDSTGSAHEHRPAPPRDREAAGPPRGKGSRRGPGRRARGDRTRAALGDRARDGGDGARAARGGGDAARHPGGDQPPAQPGRHDRGSPQAARPHRGLRFLLAGPAPARRVVPHPGLARVPRSGEHPGAHLPVPLHEALRNGRAPLALADGTIDERFTREEGAELIRSWAGIPLLVEGEVIGVLCLDRHRVDPFDEEDLHRAKAVAFSSAAAIRKAQLLEKVRRYAALMERVVSVDEAVFAGRTPAELARIILDGAMRIASYAGGVLVLEDDGGARVTARS